MSDNLTLARRWVHILSSEIGVRLAGTENDRRAADFIEAEFRAMFPDVIRHEYRFLGWKPIREGVLRIGAETYSTRLGISGPSTPEEEALRTLLHLCENFGQAAASDGEDVIQTALQTFSFGYQSNGGEYTYSFEGTLGPPDTFPFTP